MRTTRFSLVHMFGVAGILAACSDTPTEGPAVAGRIEITNPLPSLFAGDTLTQRAWAVDTDGDSIADRSLEWSSANTAVATVDDAGVVTGVAPGTTTLTASLDTASASVEVTVVAPAERPLREVAWLEDSTGVDGENDILRIGTIDGDVTGTISPFGTFVRQFTWSPTGDRLLLQNSAFAWAVMDWDGSDHTALPAVETFPQGQSAPDWSPDGSLIVYAEAAFGASLSTIQILNYATGINTLVTMEGVEGYEPQWSPDGRRVAYLLGNGIAGGRHLVIARSNGSQSRTLALANMGPGAQGLRWSPDGKLLAYADEDGVRVMTPDGRYARKLTTTCDLDTACTEKYPEWAPDGRRLAFIRQHPLGTGNATLVIRNIYQATETTVDLGACCTTWGLNWSPDGQWIATTQKIGTDPVAFAAVVVGANGTGLRVLNAASGTRAPRFRR